MSANQVKTKGSIIEYGGRSNRIIRPSSMALAEIYSFLGKRVMCNGIRFRLRVDHTHQRVETARLPKVVGYSYRARVQTGLYTRLYMYITECVHGYLSSVL